MGEKVAIDTSVFVYYLEKHRKHGPACRKILAAVERGTYDAVTSSLCVAEVLVRPFSLDERSLAAEYRTWFEHFPNLSVLAPGVDIASLAAELRAAYPLRLADALVGATAISAGCRRLFTNDRDFRVLEDRGLSVEVIGAPARP
jgi:predicted nucleic acid-binding protein